MTTTKSAPVGRKSLLSTWLVFLTGLSTVLFVLTIVSPFIGRHILVSVWDDAFMSVRYADNVISRGQIAWNYNGSPTYGLTSPLFLVIIVPLRLLLPHQTYIVSVLGSAICGVLFLLLSCFVIWKFVPAPPLHRQILFFVFATTLLLAHSSLVTHLISGMDTYFALAYITIYINICLLNERKRSPGLQILIGVLGGLSFAVRPDLMIYTAIIPIALWYFRKDRQEGIDGIKTFGITMGTMALLLLLNSFYYHSPLPLPFYAKSMGLYSNFNTEIYKPVPGKQLLHYLLYYGPFFLIILAELALCFRVWKQEATALEKGLLIATALHLLYFRFGVLQIMYYYQRFYHPTLPALILLSMRSLARLLKQIPETRWNEWTLHSALPVTLLVLVMLPGLALTARTEKSQLLPNLKKGGFATLDVHQSYEKSAESLWFGLDRFATLPDDAVIATTEVGYPSVLTKKEIIDLAGLNDTELAHNRFSPERLFHRGLPDIIYIPHPDYRDMVVKLESDPTFINNYELIPVRQKYNAMLDLAISRKSPYYQRMKEIVAETSADAVQKHWKLKQ